jgi:hypothetical protein
VRVALAVDGRGECFEGEGVWVEMVFQEGSGVEGMSGSGVEGGGRAGGSEERSVTGSLVGVVGR